MDIVKSGIQRKIHRPYILVRFQERITHASDVNLHVSGIRKAQPQTGHALRPVHQSLLAGNGNGRIRKRHHDRTAVGAGLLHDRRIIQPFLIRVHLLPHLQRQPLRHRLRRAKRPEHAVQIASKPRVVSGHPFHDNVQPSGRHGQEIINIIQAFSLRFGKLQLILQILMQLLSGTDSGKIQLDHRFMSSVFLHLLSPFSACS